MSRENPRFVHPFFVIADSSTRKDKDYIGCSKKDGSIHTEILQRDRGEVTTAFTIRQFVDKVEDDGKRILRTTVEDHDGNIVATYITEY